MTDRRPGQAERVADYLEKHPASTAKEIDAVCDTGCITKVLSDMAKPVAVGGLGYGLAKGWRREVNTAGTGRKVRTYTLLHRPTQQPDLFTLDA
jgi:hypothetical protein